jgi:hypothetical protein
MEDNIKRRRTDLIQKIISIKDLIDISLILT